MNLRSTGLATLACLLMTSAPGLADLTYTTLNDPSATNGTNAHGISNSGAVVGVYYTASGGQSFVYSNGTQTTLTGPSSSFGTFAYGINASGTVTGYYDGASGVTEGFVYSNGTYTTLNAPSATSGTYAYGINNSGSVTGYYQDASGEHGFIAVPATVPEPASLAMLGIGTLMAAGYGAHRSARARRGPTSGHA